MESSGTPVKFGLMGRAYPPMDYILGTMTRAEAQGWDFINYPDQIPGLFPEGSVPLSASPPSDETLPVSSMTNIWMSSFELITAASVLTDRMDIQLGVIDLLRRSPAIFAQEAITVSHISKGRARWCIGSGEAKQFLPYGEDRSKAVTRMEEALRTINALWESGGEPVTRESQFYQLTQAVLPQPLYDGKKPPIYMVGGAQKVVKLTAEFADGWMTYLPGGADDDPEKLREIIAKIKELTAAQGRDPEAMQFNGMVQLALHETDEQAWQAIRAPANTWFSLVATSIDAGRTWKETGYDNPLGDFMWSRDSSTTILTPKQLAEFAPKIPDPITSRAFVWGGPEKVAARLKEFIDAGLTELTIVNTVSYVDPEFGHKFPALISDVMTRLGHAPLKLEVAAG